MSRIQLLVLVIAIFWAVPAYTQDREANGSSDDQVPQTRHQNNRTYDRVREASFFDMLAWPGTALVNPHSAPDFLYGYNRLERATVDTIVVQSREGNVNITTLVREEDEPQWHTEFVPISEDLANLASRLETCGDDENCLIALSRPLQAHFIPDGQEEQMFVGRSDLWEMAR